MRAPHNKDYSRLGSILGYPYFGKPPDVFLILTSACEGLEDPGVKGKLPRGRGYGTVACGGGYGIMVLLIEIWGLRIWSQDCCFLRRASRTLCSLSKDQVLSC